MAATGTSPDSSLAGSSTGIPSSSTAMTSGGGVGQASIPLSQPSSQLQSRSMPQDDSSSYGSLGPSYTTAELRNVLSDMVDLSGTQMSEGARRNIPHWLTLFPGEQRQQLSSSDMKEWAKLAIAERKARLGMAGGSGVTTSSSTTGSGLSSGSYALREGDTLGGRNVSGTSALAASKALMGGGSLVGSGENELLESDFIFALLAMQARRDREKEQEQQRFASSTSSLSSSSSSSLGSGPSEGAMMSLMGDLAEMGNWRLGPGWEAGVRYMLDETHMAPGRRKEFMSSSRIKQWLREAARDRERWNGGQGGQQQSTVSSSGSSTGEISALNLAHALIASEHSQQQQL